MGALSGTRVLEIGSTVAGPFCGRLLADFGAEVIKVEPPTGDPVRAMGKHVKGKSLYAASIFRNKALISVDLSKPDGQKIIKQIAGKCDVVIENFRPGTLDSWGLGYDQLSKLNPRLVMARITGFGQTGTYRERPGYGLLGDALSGLLSITGFPDRPPVRSAVPVTDMLTAVYAAFGILLALRIRDTSGKGQYIDAALYEASFSLMESLIPAYQKLKELPSRSGSRLPGSTPNNLYPSRDGYTVAIAAASDSVFARLLRVIGRSDLLEDSRYRDALSRTRNEDGIDAIVSAWTGSHELADIETLLQAASVPASRVFTLADIFEDQHYRDREMIVLVPDDDVGPIAMAAPVPKLSATPGEIVWAGRRVGQDTERVLVELAGLSTAEVRQLQEAGVVRCDAKSS